MSSRGAIEHARHSGPDLDPEAANVTIAYERADKDAAAHFDRTGWLLTRALDDAGVAGLRMWVDDVSGWADEAGEWLQYHELTDGGPTLCRTENFVPFHDGLRRLLTSGHLIEVATALLGEPAALYKEKINYKLAGGAGYSPHQDAPAYRFVDVHVSCLVAIDDATVENGCLEVVSGAHAEVLPMDGRGCIRGDVVDSMTWMPVEVRAGETLWFHSRTPHRSGPNRSSAPRRALYPTYNAASEGDLRAAYYRKKLEELAAAGDDPERIPVSLSGDFEGRPVR